MVHVANAAQPCGLSSGRRLPSPPQLLESYQQICQKTLEVALSGRLPANHEIIQQQRTLYEFDHKIRGMLPLRGYGHNYPANLR